MFIVKFGVFFVKFRFCIFLDNFVCVIVCVFGSLERWLFMFSKGIKLVVYVGFFWYCFG